MSKENKQLKDVKEPLIIENVSIPDYKLFTDELHSENKKDEKKCSLCGDTEGRYIIQCPKCSRWFCQSCFLHKINQNCPCGFEMPEKEKIKVYN